MISSARAKSTHAIAVTGSLHPTPEMKFRPFPKWGRDNSFLSKSQTKEASATSEEAGLTDSLKAPHGERQGRFPTGTAAPRAQAPGSDPRKLKTNRFHAALKGSSFS